MFRIPSSEKMRSAFFPTAMLPLSPSRPRSRHGLSVAIFTAVWRGTPVTAMKLATTPSMHWEEPTSVPSLRYLTPCSPDTISFP